MQNKKTISFSNSLGALKVRNFRYWIIGSFISVIGNNIQRTAQDWVVIAFLSGGKAYELGITLGLQFGPQLLLLPLTGWVVDRFNLKRLVMTTQIGQCLLATTTAILFFTNSATLDCIKLLALALGIVSAFDSPARQKFVASFVSKEQLPSAVSLNSTMFNLGRLIAPALAGLLIATIGVDWCFAINAASFLLIFLSLFFIRNLGQANASDSNISGNEKTGGILDGWHHIYQNPNLLCSVIIIFIASAFVMNYSIFLSKIVLDDFHLGSGTYGFLLTLQSLGNVLGAFTLVMKNKSTMRFIMRISLAICFIFLLLAEERNILLLALTLPLAGYCTQMLTTAINSYLLINTEQALRGRVVAIFLAVFVGATPFGALLMGYLSDHIGVRLAILLAAIAMFVTTVAVFILLIKLRDLEVKISKLDLSEQDENSIIKEYNLSGFTRIYIKEKPNHRAKN